MTSRCGHCREEGHNIQNCKKLELEVPLNIFGRESGAYKTDIKRKHIRFSKLKLDKGHFAKVHALIANKIPCIALKSNTHYPEYKYFVARRMEDNSIQLTLEDANTEYKAISDEAIRANSQIIVNYMDEFKRRIAYYRNGTQMELIQVANAHNVLTGDYVHYTEQVAERKREREAREAAWEAAYREREAARIAAVQATEAQARAQAINIALRDQREAQASARQKQVDEILNREQLPIIRETVIETEDCPICLDVLGETGKTILRCGHQLCTSCLMSQTLRSIVLKTTNRCRCPVCRTPYIRDEDEDEDEEDEDW